MARTISTRNTAKASTANPSVKPTPEDTFIGIKIAIYFYEI